MTKLANKNICSIGAFCVLLSTIFLANIDGQQTSVTQICSVSEMKSFQRHWNWLTRETTTAQKVALYHSIVDYIIKKHPTLMQEFQSDMSAEELALPIEVRAYRMFTDTGLYLNAYTSPDVYVSMIEHFVMKFPLLMGRLLQHMSIMMDANIHIIGNLIGQGDEKNTWETCWTNVMENIKEVYERFQFQARCDIEPTSGNPDQQIHGHIGFRQMATGGRTTVHVELTGFVQSTGRRVMRIHEGNTTADRCPPAGPHASPKKIDPTKNDGHARQLGNLKIGQDNRVYSTFNDDQVALFGPDSIIGNLIVIHEQEDEATQGDAGHAAACCVIRQTYD